MADSKAIRAGKAYVELGLDDSLLLRGLKGAERKLANWGKSLTTLGAKIGASVAPAIVAGLAAVAEFAQTGEQLSLMSQRTLLSVESLSALGYAAQSVGGDLDTVNDALTSMNGLLMQARDGGADANFALAQLGTSINGLGGIDAEQRLRLLADGLARIESPTRRAALAQQVFGGAAGRLLPLLSQGSAGIGRLMEEARRAGAVMSGEDAQAALEFSRALRELRAQLFQIVLLVGAAVTPALRGVVDWLKEVVPVVIDWINDNRALVAGLFIGAAAIAAVGLALAGLGVAATAASFAVAGLVLVVKLLVAVLAFLVSPIGLILLAIAAVLYFTGTWRQAVGFLRSTLADIADYFSEVFGGIADAIGAGRIDLAVKIAGLAIKASWFQAVGWLEMRWLEFRDFVLDGWDVLQHVLATLMNQGWAAIKLVWLGAINSLENMWFGMIDGVAASILPMVRQIVGAIAFARSIADSPLDVAGAAGARTAAMAGVNFAAAGGESPEARQARYSASARQIAQQRDATQDNLDAEVFGNVAAREAHRRRREQEIAQAIGGARGELDEALGEAGFARFLSESKRSISARAAGVQGGIDPFTGLRRGSVTGGFGGAALAALGGGNSPEERTAENTRRIADFTRRILERGGLTFAA